MRKMKVEKWTSKGRDESGNPKDVDESIMVALTALMGDSKNESIRGLDKFRTYARVAKAFEAADKSGELVLEEADYVYLKGLIEKGAPAMWAFNPNILKAIDEFVELKSAE